MDTFLYSPGDFHRKAAGTTPAVALEGAEGAGEEGGCPVLPHHQSGRDDTARQRQREEREQPRSRAHMAPLPAAAQKPITAAGPVAGCPATQSARLPPEGIQTAAAGDGTSQPAPRSSNTYPHHPRPRRQRIGEGAKQPVLCLRSSVPKPTRASEMAEQREPRSVATASPIGRGGARRAVQGGAPLASHRGSGGPVWGPWPRV